MKIIKCWIIFFILVLFYLLNISADVNNNSKVYGGIEDIYTFESNGFFERTSVIWLAHDNKNGSMNLTFSQPFPDYTQENHKILGSINYFFYGNQGITDNITKTPQNDYKKGQSIVDIILNYGDRAHIERIYEGYYSNNNINLGLNFQLIRYNSICENISCGFYDYQYFDRIIKIKKNSDLFGLKDLKVTNFISTPDKVYEDGEYRVYIWNSYTLDTGDLKFQDIHFSYEYILSERAYSLFFSIFGIIVGFIISAFFFKKDKSKEILEKIEKESQQNKKEIMEEIKKLRNIKKRK